MTKKNTSDWLDEVDFKDTSLSGKWYRTIKREIEDAYGVITADTFDEIDEIVGTKNILNIAVNEEEYREVSDIEHMKSILVTNLYARLISHLYHQTLQPKGPKSDRLRRFFRAITTEPQDSYDLADRHYIAYTTLKNHRRYDPFPEKGITKIKDGKIYRQPV